MLNIQTAISESKFTPFLFTDQDGVERELPHMGLLDTEVAVAIETQPEQILDHLEGACGKEITDVIRRMPNKLFFDVLLPEWQKHSAVEAGESAASSSS
jgi:hypothetical protein